ncbi:hypothetical protein N7513_000924 [Penicillium frequentans]|nr:hypothetical protein N7513_000924 [Penicillium glabrum]
MKLDACLAKSNSGLQKEKNSFLAYVYWPIIRLWKYNWNDRGACLGLGTVDQFISEVRPSIMWEKEGKVTYTRARVLINRNAVMPHVSVKIPVHGITTFDLAVSMAVMRA